MTFLISISAPRFGQSRHRLIGTFEKWKAIPTRTNSNFRSEGGRGLSRTERRFLERKERNREKRKSRMPGIDNSPNNKFGKERWQRLLGTRLFSFFSNAQGLKSLFEPLVPRIPGRNVRFSHRSLWIALGFRLPLFMALSYVITNENTSPYVIQGSLGPSMLPTIQFVGDIWLVETGAWRRAWISLFQQDKANFPPVKSWYEVGDLVIWEDPRNGKRSCKRIIGLEGDTVHRFGEYRELYRNRSDAGILWPKNKGKTAGHVFGDFSTRSIEKQNENGGFQLHGEEGGVAVGQSSTITVPKQCVWLEGDCPLFSMDSRQYGPIHVSKIRGRLIFRLWPWDRHDLKSDEENSYLTSCWISKNRPVPYPSINAYIGNRFGLHRVQSSANDEI